MMKALCIGGPLDGKWRDVTGPDLHNIEIKTALPSLKPTEIVPSQTQIRRYVIEMISTPKRKFYLAIEDGLSLEYALDRLMHGYKP
jgi:hypothetical protein